MAAKSAKESAEKNENPATQWADQVKGLFEKYKLPGVDLEAIAEWQKKELEALNEASRQASAFFSTLVKRRGEILEETLQEWQVAVKEASATGEGLGKQGEAARERLKKAMSNVRELAELEVKAHSDAWKVLQDRLQENMSSLQKLIQPKK